jgi:hypothetical protein
MPNIKWAAAAGVFAFILSLLIGLISRTGLYALFRAMIFGVVFFFLGGGAHWLISRFLSELLDGGEEELTENALGAAVDISLGEDAFGDGTFGEGSLPGHPLDQKTEDGYTKEGQVGGNPAFPVELPPDFNKTSPAEGGDEPLGDGMSPAIPAASAGNPADNSGGDPEAVDDLPDMDAMAASFAPSQDEPEPEAETVLLAPSDITGGEKKNQELMGNFNTHDMASAIQTILKREKG